MKAYAESLIPEDDIALFRSIKRIVEGITEPNLGVDEGGEPILLSCHMLARALAHLFPVTVEDGMFAGIFSHSWLRTCNGNVIDAYPVGAVGGPMLIDGMRFSPGKMLFKRASSHRVAPGLFRKNSFRRSVRRVTRALRQFVHTQSEPSS